MNELFAEWDRADSPGCAVGVVEGGRLVYASGYGMANLEYGIANAPDSVFHVASVSKQFTAQCVSLLGIDLDGDVRRWLPEVPAALGPITVRQLLTHTGGLRDQWDLLRLAGWRSDDLKTDEDVLDLVGRQQALNFAPGAEHLYSNTGFTLAGVMVRRASGMTLRQFAQERIFGPLGMGRTHFHDDHREVVAGRAYGHEPGWRISIPAFDTVGATSLFTTVEDLARWVVRIPEVLAEPGRLSDGTMLEYGLGLRVATHRGLRTIGHGGADAGYRSHVLWFPERDLGVIVLANLSTIKPGVLALQIADEWLGLAAPPALPPATLPAGLYRNPETGLLRRIEDSELSDELGNRWTLRDAGAGRYVYGDYGAEVDIAFDGAVREGRAVYAPAEPWKPDSVAPYTGAYTSAELGVTWELAAEGGALVVRRRKFPDAVLRPTAAGAFTDGRMHLVMRGGGFDVSTVRVRRLAFRRD